MSHDMLHLGEMGNPQGQYGTETESRSQKRGMGGIANMELVVCVSVGAEAAPSCF